MSYIKIILLFCFVLFSNINCDKEKPISYTTVEISQEPTIIFTRSSHHRLTLNGHAIGDPETSFTPKQIADKQNDEIILDKSSYSIADGKVISFSIYDQKIISKLGIKTMEDMIKKLGPSEKTDGNNVDFKIFSYYKLGLIFGWTESEDSKTGNRKLYLSEIVVLK